MSGFKQQLAAQARQRSARTSDTKHEPPKSSSPPATTTDWPAPPTTDALHGVAGGFVEIVSPHSEADPIALLIQFLIAVGNVLGRTAYAAAESARHHVNLFAVLVGKSAKGRKGRSEERRVGKECRL